MSTKILPTNGAAAMLPPVAASPDDSRPHRAGRPAQCARGGEVGRLHRRMPLEWTGVAGKVADGLNDVIIAPTSPLGLELARVSHVVGGEGKLSQRLSLGGRPSAWSESVDSVNEPDRRPRATHLRDAAGDRCRRRRRPQQEGHRRRRRRDARAQEHHQRDGRPAQRIRVGGDPRRPRGRTEGKLGQAAAVTIEVGGVWKDLTDNVNLMAGNLTGRPQHRRGHHRCGQRDLSKKISIDVKGEFLELKNTVNAMVDQLNSFASEVTVPHARSASRASSAARPNRRRSPALEGPHRQRQPARRQSHQPGARHRRCRHRGDRRRPDPAGRVEASGEVADLKDKLNEMIRNLRETTRQNTEQDWLKTNLERFTRCSRASATSRGFEPDPFGIRAARVGHTPSSTRWPGRGRRTGAAVPGRLRLQGAQAPRTLPVGEGLVGQCAKEKQRILLTDVPARLRAHQFRSRRRRRR